jgi:uncharacterized protein YggT (Ycf19 family)
MASERQERVRVQRGDGFERRQRVVEYAPSMQRVIVSRVNQLIALAAGIVALLIAFRVILKLIAANAASGFVEIIYTLTDGLLSPFAGLIENPTLNNGGVVEVTSLFALVVYVLAAWVIMQLIWILFSGTRARRSVTTIERENLN